jgi:hypothetical protein
MPKQQFRRFFSVDNPKALKAQKLGWLNAINYMAPHRSAGVGDLCGNASAGCIALCLGEHSGNAALYPTVMRSRIAKARYFMKDRKAFLVEMAVHIASARRQAKQAKLKLCVRLNGATDLAWEGLSPSTFADNPDIQFVDYTKSPKRALAHAQGKMPRNYHLTFSRSETNEADCLKVLAAGGSVAVVSSLPRPDTYLGAPTIDGDQSDLRHLDPRGVIVWLTPKGNKAKRDTSGFVVRS